MKTLIEYIEKDADLPTIKAGLKLERWSINQVIEKTTQYWQKEILQTTWYKENQNNIKLMIQCVETNESDAKEFLEGITL